MKLSRVGVLMKYILFILTFILINISSAVYAASEAGMNLDSLLKVEKKLKKKAKPDLYLQIAQAYQKARDYDESVNYLQKIIEIYKNDVYNTIMMKAFYVLGDDYLYLQLYDNAFKALSKALEIASKIEDKEFQIKIHLLFGYGYQEKMEYDKSIEYLDKAVEIAGNQETSDIISKVYYVRGKNYIAKGYLDKGLTDFLKALDIAKLYNDKKNMSVILNNIGMAYRAKGEYQKAVEYYQQNLKTQESLGDSAEMGKTLNNLGYVYFSFGIYAKAIEYYNKSLEIYQRLNSVTFVGYLNLNIGISYSKLKNNKKAFEYLKKSYDIFQKIGFQKGLANAKAELGSFYAVEGNFGLALKYQEEALKLYKDLGEDINTAVTLRTIAETYYKSGNFPTALNYYKQSLALEEKIGLKTETLDNYKDISEVYAKMGDYKSAFDHSKLYSNLKDTILGEQYLKQIQELGAKYETDKKEKEIQLQKSELSKKEIEGKRQKMFVYGLSLIVLIVLGFLFVIYKQFQEKKKANILLAEQNDEIKMQRDQIFQQKKEITDSIHYASRIQRAVLPSSRPIEDAGMQYFILYKPRDIVSGDFYWINQKDEKVIIAAADCTGHGVPGAFMSMLGMALLNEIVSKGEFESAGHILFELRRLVVKSLHQSGKQEETKDGMDIALCILDKEKNTAQFAGAFNPMYLIRNGEILEAPADRMPVGFHDKIDSKFTNTEYELLKGDAMYIFSDGYVDQFGGENGKKFMAKKFKQLLVSMQDMPMEKQKEHLDKTITDWRGELDQVDDIMVIGMRV